MIGLAVSAAIGTIAAPLPAAGHARVAGDGRVAGVARVVADAFVAGHARVAGTSPADGSAVEAPPARVTITFAAKLVTVEGDPLRVYDPSGHRIDDGEVRLERDGEVLSVGLAAGGAAAPGRYAVAYHVVSADSHVVVGRFAFTVTSGESVAPHPAPDRRPPRTGPADMRPELAAAGVGVVGVAGRLRRARAARRSNGAAPRSIWSDGTATRPDGSTDGRSGPRTLP